VFSSWQWHDDHGVCRANMAWALAWWRRLGALHEATEMLHRLMCFTPYRPSCMVVGFAVKIATLFYIIDNRVATNKLISLLFYLINWIALTEPSTIPSSMSGLRWIGSNYKIRAAGGSGNSPWCGCLRFVFCCCIMGFPYYSHIQNLRGGSFLFPPEPLKG